MENVLQLIVVAIGSSGLMSLIQYLLQRNDKKAKQIDEICTKLQKFEKDLTRLQLMLLMTSYPDRKAEITEVAHHYFIDDKGNWYMTNMFKDWCEANDFEIHIWDNQQNLVPKIFQYFFDFTEDLSEDLKKCPIYGHFSQYSGPRGALHMLQNAFKYVKMAYFIPYFCLFGYIYSNIQIHFTEESPKFSSQFLPKI